MEKKDLGKEIKNMVQTAINTGNFKGLNKDIEDRVKDTFTELGKPLSWVSTSDRTKRPDPSKRHTNALDKKSETIRPIRPVKAKGQLPGTLLTVFGGMGSLFFGTSIFVTGVLGYTVGLAGLFHTTALLMVPFFAASSIALYNGRKIQKKMKRVDRYIMRLGNNKFCQIRELADSVGLSDKATVADLRMLIKEGVFPQGHIDYEELHFILDDDTYDEYLKLREIMEIREEDLAQRDQLEPKVLSAIEEGKNFIQEIRRANDHIAGEEVSAKLDQLDQVTGKIFDFVSKHPEKLPEIKKFTEYFLPTTLKLLEGYKKLDSQPVQGPNIKAAKVEIEQSLDTINQAFENLLDSLFSDMAMDISTDISVLKTMLAQEGLTGSNFDKRDK